MTEVFLPHVDIVHSFTRSLNTIYAIPLRQTVILRTRWRWMVRLQWCPSLTLRDRASHTVSWTAGWEQPICTKWRTATTAENGTHYGVFKAWRCESAFTNELSAKAASCNENLQTPKRRLVGGWNDYLGFRLSTGCTSISLQNPKCASLPMAVNWLSVPTFPRIEFLDWTWL